jgi:hypothetical protein
VGAAAILFSGNSPQPLIRRAINDAEYMPQVSGKIDREHAIQQFSPQPLTDKDKTGSTASKGQNDFPL